MCQKRSLLGYGLSVRTVKEACMLMCSAQGITFDFDNNMLTIPLLVNGTSHIKSIECEKEMFVISKIYT